MSVTASFLKFSNSSFGHLCRNLSVQTANATRNGANFQRFTFHQTLPATIICGIHRFQPINFHLYYPPVNIFLPPHTFHTTSLTIFYGTNTFKATTTADSERTEGVRVICTLLKTKSHSRLFPPRLSTVC